MRKLMTLAVLAGVLLIVSFGCSKEKSEQDELRKPGDESTLTKGWDEEKEVAKVNGVAITEGQVAKRENILRQQMAGRVSHQQLESMRSAIRQQAVDYAVNRVLLEEAIKKEGIEVSVDDIDSRIDDYKMNFSSEEEFSNQLAISGMTEEGFRGEIEVGLKVEKLFAGHRSGIGEVSESEIRSYYDENLERFKRAERVKSSHILIKVGKDESEKEKAEKRRKAAKILREIEDGADFAELASKYSDCPSKSKGGDLGYFGRGRMVPAFEDVAFSLGVGNVSDIVETDFGYHIIKIYDHEKARTIPFEEARKDITAFLDNKRNQDAMTAYVDNLRSAAVIEYADSIQSP
ncbi:MAG: peptidylprolyl isomerase [Candidatus Krumholzibacteria bacterium]|nr:peptidylprolyl isomerase [Candidatus Krumholzibacteria bacterium]